MVKGHVQSIQKVSEEFFFFFKQVINELIRGDALLDLLQARKNLF